MVRTVMCVGSHTTHLVNGLVGRVCDDREYYTGIEFSRCDSSAINQKIGFQALHECGGECPGGTGWYLDKSYLTIIRKGEV